MKPPILRVAMPPAFGSWTAVRVLPVTRLLWRPEIGGEDRQ